LVVSLQRKKKIKTIAYQKVISTKDANYEKRKISEISMLQYQIKRYQAAGKGTMCQSLNARLQKLIKQQAEA